MPNEETIRKAVKTNLCNMLGDSDFAYDLSELVWDSLTINTDEEEAEAQKLFEPILKEYIETFVAILEGEAQVVPVNKPQTEQV